MKQIFPKEFINSSIQHYTFKINRYHSGVYLVLLIATVSFIVSLPFIFLDITIDVLGVVDTKTQRYNLVTATSGKVESLNISENQIVEKGDVLLTIDNSALREELNQIKSRINQVKDYLADLESLIQHSNDIELLSDRYKIEFLQYKSRLDRLDFENLTFSAIFNRQKRLLDQKVIARVDFERDEANYERSLKEIELYKRTSKSNWKEASLKFSQEIKSLQLRKKQIENELPKYILVSPASGELQNVNAFIPGQFIQSGQTIAQLTPDTTLYAVCWVSPKKIGLLKKGLKGFFRIDAFNYNDWGLVTGTIDEVSSDAYVINNQPLFKVTCKIEKSQLELENGFVGKLKKGMTIQGNFIVANRSLYDLLYDKIDNWANPTIR